MLSYPMGEVEKMVRDFVKEPVVCVGVEYGTKYVNGGQDVDYLYESKSGKHIVAITSPINGIKVFESDGGGRVMETIKFNDELMNTLGFEVKVDSPNGGDEWGLASIADNPYYVCVLEFDGSRTPMPLVTKNHPLKTWVSAFIDTHCKRYGEKRPQWAETLPKNIDPRELERELTLVKAISATL